MIIAKPLSSINAERDALQHKLMRELTASEVICCDILRMGPVAFAEFCGKLRATGLLKDFRHATVEEQVAKFLQILGQNFRNRALGFFFHQSGETISHHFHNVLRVVVALEAEFLNQPTGADVPTQILNNNRFYPYFKKRFPIIASGIEPHYSFETMTEIVLACCIIHNFLMGVDPDENLIAEVDRELMHAEVDHHVGTSGLATDADYRIGVMLREQIASQMWNDYYNNL
ncbi:hypothetical protein GH714_020129 [Hevea brasiliensis]|uniref:DUF8040 domain-containing protein n=1 Tax=Hevea brasiliensis TaxID=3981 RepID=A0A6A6MBR7_HEVBR|nr:hypothetical protein GH714_020129 [Hevea brasiliensis]